MALKDDLKNYLPEIYRNHPSMDEFLSAVGEHFDGFINAIDGFKTYSDSQKISEDKIDNLAEQFKIKFLRNTSLERKRQFVSEAIDLYRTNGSEKAMRRIFRLIGWKVSIDECWTVEPAYYGSHTTLDLTNDLGAAISINEYDLLFGSEKMYNGQMYVDIKDVSNNFFYQQPIYGETYSSWTPGYSFVKVPYIRIQINAEDYKLFTQDYVDPVTGQVYSYTQQENYTILEDIKKFFLDQSRPTHVAIFEISTPFGQSDTILYTATESMVIDTVCNGPSIDGTICLGLTDPYNIDRYISGEQMGGFFIGNNTMDYFGIGVSAPEESYSIEVTKKGLSKHYLLRQSTTIRLYAPADSSVSVQATKSNGREIITQSGIVWDVLQPVFVDGDIDLIVGTGSFSEMPISTIGLTEQHYVININDYKAMRFNVVTQSATGSITAFVTYNP